MKLKYIFSSFLILLIVFANAQSNKTLEIADGDEHLKHYNYLMALPLFKQMLRYDKENTEIQMKIAECYLNTNINKVEAIKYLEFCVQDPKIKPEAWLKLGYAYRYGYKIDEAIKAFQKYMELVPKKKKLAEREIQTCYNAKILMRRPVNVSFTNLGKDLNSEYPDYYPWITQDENFLAFTTRRKGGSSAKPESDGYYASDVFTSTLENGKWTKAISVGKKINSGLDEQVVGLKADASEMLIYIDHIDEFGDIYTSEKKNGEYGKYKPLPPNVNQKIEHSGSISVDGNTLFFVRAEARGAQTDIYICRKLPSGSWSEPLKLGPEVNSPFDEDFPYLSIDGKTLYFSSQGHNSMGGFDLFKSTWDSEANIWTKAENLGYPVNTTDDDKSISITPDNRVGYISACRPGGCGDLDIYRIKFNDVDQKLTIYLCNVILGDSLNKPTEYYVNVTAVNKATDEEFSFSTNPLNGSLVMPLPAGNYELTVSADGYQDLKDKLTVSDIGLPISEEKKKFVLKKK